MVAGVSWLLRFHKNDGFEEFCDILRSQDFSLDIRKADKLKSLDLYREVITGCSRAIERGCSSTLAVFLDTLLELGLCCDQTHKHCGTSAYDSTQLAILRALLSPDSSFLRILLEKGVVSTKMQPFGLDTTHKHEHGPVFSMGEEEHERPPRSMPHWPLYSALALVRDVEVLQMLRQKGASVSQTAQERPGTKRQRRDEPAILKHLRGMTGVDDARVEYLDTRMFYLELSGALCKNENQTSVLIIISEQTPESQPRTIFLGFHLVPMLANF